MWFYHSPISPCAYRRAYLLGHPFRALGRGSYSCLSSWRILGSNSPLSVPDLVLLAVPTGFQGASWRQIPPWQCPIGRSWLCRLASKAHLGLKRPLCCHTLASKRRRLRHLRPTCQQRRQRYRAICVRAAFLSAAVVRSTMNIWILYRYYCLRLLYSFKDYFVEIIMFVSKIKKNTIHINYAPRKLKL